MKWLNDNAGGMQAITAVLIVLLTAVLIGVTLLVCPLNTAHGVDHGTAAHGGLSARYE
jgi:putative effector of murein hydrolase